MTLRSLREQLAESAGAGELGIGNTRYPRGRIEIEQDFFGSAARRLLGVEDELILFAPHSDRIEFLEPETDWIDQVVAAGAHRGVGVHGETAAIGQWLAFVQRRKIRIHTWRRIRNCLAQELLADKQSTAGRSRIARLTSRSEEQSLTEDSRSFRSRRQLHTVPFARWPLHAVDRRQIGIDKGVCAVEHFPKIAIVPDDVSDEALRLLGHR